MMAYEFTRTIKFADVDPAAIVFYPRYFEMINETVEEWFRHGLGIDFMTLTQERNRGVPLVHIEVDFMKPGFLYDELVFKLSPTRIGNSSVDIHIVATVMGEAVLKCDLVLAHINLKEKTGQPFDDDLRAKMSSFMEA